MSPVLGPDGKPLVQETGGKLQCILCEGAELLDPQTAAKDDVYYEDGVAHGYAIGVQLLATVLIGCGLEPEKALHVQQTASSLCEGHGKLVGTFVDANGHRAPVERAVENLRQEATFFVGRGPGGKVKGIGP